MPPKEFRPMAAWFTVVAPFLPDIIQMAKPMFTRDKGADKIPQQIKELQDAATQNADAIKQLAGEMQRTLATLQHGATQLENTLASLQQRNGTLERELRRANRLSLVAATVAVLAFALSAYALAR
jgi:uncharacterized phage infection (PIP) family protein YhgE